MVTHIDYDKDAWNNNTVNTDINHQRYSVVGASGEFTESIADLFPGTSGNTSFTDVTNPASTLFNVNEDGTYFLHKAVENISESNDGTISFVACTYYAPFPQDIKAITNPDGTVICSWSAVEDAVGYELEVNGTYLYPSPYNHTLMEEKFKNLPKEEGTDDISGKLDYYCTYPSWTGEGLYASANGIKIKERGKIYSPILKMSDKGYATVIVHTSPYIATEASSYFAYICNNELGDYLGSDTFDQETSKLFSINMKANKEYRIVIEAETKPLLLHGVYLYDGNYDVDDFNRESDPSIQEILEPEIISTNTNSYLFGNVLKDYTYTFRLRTKLSDGVTSLWTQPFTFNTTTGIEEVETDPLPQNSDSSAIYDITGRRVTSASRPGIYIQNGKKIIIGRGK